MRVLHSLQCESISDSVRAKFAMTVPVLEALLYSLAGDRVDRLGGYPTITLQDLAREFREGNGDAGICFEWAIHQAIADQHPLITPLASEVLEDLCKIPGGAHSILFGPEKNGRIPIIESVQDSLTDGSRVYVGNRGRPAHLKKYIPQIVKAFHRHEARNKLPRSIQGLWKADLFLGNAANDQWVGTTVKINEAALQGAQGLRIGIYPKKDSKDVPRHDDTLNLIRLPLPYDNAFMELFYKSFFLVRAFMKADARVPQPVALTDSEDRYVTSELEARRGFPILDVIEVIRDMSQEDLLSTSEVASVEPTAALSEDHGLETDAPVDTTSESVSLTPTALHEGS